MPDESANRLMYRRPGSAYKDGVLEDPGNDAVVATFTTEEDARTWGPRIETALKAAASAKTPVRVPENLGLERVLSTSKALQDGTAHPDDVRWALDEAMLLHKVRASMLDEIKRLRAFYERVKPWLESVACVEEPTEPNTDALELAQGWIEEAKTLLNGGKVGTEPHGTIRVLESAEQGFEGFEVEALGETHAIRHEGKKWVVDTFSPDEEDSVDNQDYPKLQDALLYVLPSKLTPGGTQTRRKEGRVARQP